jgi:transcriptional regulator with XRE-family HTH domain
MTSKKAGKSKSILNVKFGERLAALRNAQKWSLTYMEQHSGLSESFLYEMEHGIKEPCLNTLDILAKSFDMTMSKLLKGI